MGRHIFYWLIAYDIVWTIDVFYWFGKCYYSYDDWSEKWLDKKGAIYIAVHFWGAIFVMLLLLLAEFG